MKNIHIIATDKPSRLQLQMNGNFHIENGKSIALRSYQNIFITNDEEIKEGDWVLSKLNELILLKKNYTNFNYSKIILTTNQDLIKDGVQAIPDEFLEWFVNNSSCEEIEIEVIEELFNRTSSKYDFYKIIIPNGKIRKSFQEISKNCGKGERYCEGQSEQCQCDKIWKKQYFDAVLRPKEELSKIEDVFIASDKMDDLQEKRKQDNNKNKLILDRFIKAIREEFPEDDWDYLDNIRDRVIYDN